MTQIYRLIPGKPMTANKPACVVASILLACSLSLVAQQKNSSSPEKLPTGMSITPTAARGSTFEPLNPDLADRPEFTVDHPITTAISPNGNTLLVLTSGYNRNVDEKGHAVPGQISEYVFVYDIRKRPPVKQQALKVPNTYAGLVWAPDGNRFYVSGGSNDNVHVFEKTGGEQAQADAKWAESKEAIPLG